MWVSTTGEDSPQCIHDTPTSDPVPSPLHLNESCRSLNYALTHIGNDSLIVIGCGIHVLEPVDSLLDGTPLMNVTTIALMSGCESDETEIQCTNGTNLEFYNVKRIVIKQLVFRGCGEQLQNSGSLSDSSTLYFQNSGEIQLQHLNIIISGPYGRGISVIRHDTTDTHGDVFMNHVRIDHYGFHGAGIHFEALAGNTRAASLTNDKCQLTNIHVNHYNMFPNFNLATSFTGINITVMGNKEYDEIAVSNVYVDVDKTTRSNAISVALDSASHRHSILFQAIAVNEGCMKFNHLPYVTTNAENNSTADSSIKIELRGNSTRNRIQIGSVKVIKCSAVPGSELSIEATDHSEENVILLQNLHLVGATSTEVHSRGLQVLIRGWARRNEILVEGFTSWNHRASWGAGGYIEFSGNAMGNSVQFGYDSILFNNLAHRGGGMAVVCKDFATQNTFQALYIQLDHNFAELGGGLYFIFQGASWNNTIQLTFFRIIDNTAHSGGGMLGQFQDSSVTNKVEIEFGYFEHNTLVLSEEYDMMGGGVHVEFSTVNATFRTDNTVKLTMCMFLFNSAGQGVGGGISVLYRHPRHQGNSGDRVIVSMTKLLYSEAASGSACAFRSLPTHGKRLFTGIQLAHVQVWFVNSGVWAVHRALQKMLSNNNVYHGLFYKSFRHFLKHLSHTFIPSVEAESNKNLIFAKSVQITAHTLIINCGASSQGIYALDSEIVLQRNELAELMFCVATHGGAIALHGESYIRVGRNSTLSFFANHAFQRGGAIYASSAPAGVVPVSNCFLQCDQEWKENSSAAKFYLIDNTAKTEGQSIYVSDVRNCISGSTLKNATTSTVKYYRSYQTTSLQSFAGRINFTFTYNIFGKHNSPAIYISQLTSKEDLINAVHKDVMSGPNYVSSVTVDLGKPVTIRFIPGKQKRLPYTHTYDEFGSTINSVFSVLINKMDGSLPVEVDPFSKYTADFTIIIHGIPPQHGMANHSFPSNTNNTSAVVRPPQLVLQSVDNTDLLLVMNIELQCCPPGYIYRYGSHDMGTCHCGVLSMIGIADCNESHPEVIGAVLERDHWAGYLPSDDQHSCDGQKFFTGLCPPGYCQIQPITLPHNSSQLKLQDTVCTGTSRKGLLCGDCLEGNSIAVNFNGIRPVCVGCEDGFSKAGILVWILSEWVPMLTFMFVLMLFNIDLVSGRFNSFLLFAQLLAFSTIRGDVELGPVHNAFVRIYRFLYGMWNLDFFGVLLPPYCLTPHANLTLLQTLLLHHSIGLFPLTVTITLIVLERSAEKWICCHRVDQCLRRMRRWKAKYSDGMSYDRALPAFVILGFTRFLVSSSYILVHQTITGEGGERKVVVWWQGSVPYGSIQHIAYFIPAIVILLVFVLLPSFVLLTLPIGPQLFGRLLIAVPPLRKLQRMQTFCSNVYTDRWVYHFVNVFQGCYNERFRSFSSLYLFHRIVHLLVAVFISRAEDALRIQIFLTVALLLLISTLQPYNSHKLNNLDAAILGNLALILILSLHITDLNTPIGTRQFFASLQMILIYLPLLYPGILLGMKVYLKCRQLRCCQKQEEESEDNAEPLLEAPAERLGNLVLITELRAGVPTSEDDDTVTETETET